jgi:DNA primase
MFVLSLSPQFLDEVRGRTSLSALIGASIKLVRKGSEYKACCPFHNEKTPSFTVNDDKAFGHCFGCGWHGDAIRWLTDYRGLDFIAAVQELATRAGMEMPAPSPAAAQRARAVADASAVLETAEGWYRARLSDAPGAQKVLADRGVTPALAERFGFGFSPGSQSVTACGVALADLAAAGLMVETPDGWRDRFRLRIMIPIHDARGRLIAFGGRATNDRQDAKYINSPEGAHFDKGRTLYNLHRAAPMARVAGRLIIVEGYFDVMSLDAIGIGEVVAPMGTALTEAQLERAWRVQGCPILMLDGDKAGRSAALKACMRAMPMLGPDASLNIALLPEGEDPDSLARAQGASAIEVLLTEAVPLSRFVFDALVEAGPIDTPEDRAGLWQRLQALASEIGDDETRAQYLATWRARFDREYGAVASADDDPPALHALIAAEDGDYAWPDDQNDSERRLIMIVQRVIELRRARDEISATIKDLLAMAKAAGFSVKALGALVRDIEADTALREDHEAIWALYRRVLGVKGPMTEAMLPSPVEARRIKESTAVQRRLSRAMVMIEARHG